MKLLIACLLLSAVVANYTDSEARNVMLPLAAGAYAENPQMCLTNNFGKTAQIKRQLNVECDFFVKDTCSGFTALLPDQKAIVVSFRGTNKFFQLVQEGTKSVFKDKMPWLAGGKVSKYFGDAFVRLWNQGIKDDFLTLQSQNPNFEIWLTGHSLGGALASLAGSYMIATNIASASNIKLVTYGQPRVGDKDFSAAHDAQMTYAYRVTHWKDIVPHVPPEDFEDYYHAKTEVFYKEKMKPTQYTVCKKDEDKDCSDGLLITTNIDEHLHYFNHDMNVWGEKGCQQ